MGQVQVHNAWPVQSIDTSKLIYTIFIEPLADLGNQDQTPKASSFERPGGLTLEPVYFLIFLFLLFIYSIFKLYYNYKFYWFNYINYLI